MRNIILSAVLLASAFQTALGEQAGDWSYAVENNQVAIIGYTGAGGAVTIPNEVNGVPVKKVGSGWLSIFGNGNTSVTSVVIPNSVTSIGNQAFYSCTGLTSITIPNSVTSIGDYAFSNCINLKSITFGNSVTSIGDYAFVGAHGLTTLTIPNSVMEIGEYAFYSCTGLTSVTLGNSSTTIRNGAFYYCSSLRVVNIPDGFKGYIDYDIFPVTAVFVSPDLIESLAKDDSFVNGLAHNEVFVTAVANKMKSELGTLATKSELSSAISTAIEPLATKSELSTLATKSELTSAITESRTAGVNSVLSNPNLWTLYTTSQIQNMAMGDLVLTKQVNGKFALNYDIEQSEDLKTWTTYRALYLPLNGLPTDKAFVRIKMINSSSNPSAATPVGSNMY